MDVTLFNTFRLSHGTALYSVQVSLREIHKVNKLGILYVKPLELHVIAEP